MCDPDVGAHCDLEPTAQGVAMDRSDHRHGQLLPHPTDLLTSMGDATRRDVARVPLGLPLAVTGHPREHREVETGAERLPFAGQHDHPEARRVLQCLARSLDGSELGSVERVALVGAVEADVGDAVDDGDGDAV